MFFFVHFNLVFLSVADLDTVAAIIIIYCIKHMYYTYFLYLR